MKCDECGLSGGYHRPECYHRDCDEDDQEVHRCGPGPDGGPIEEDEDAD